MHSLFIHARLYSSTPHRTGGAMLVTLALERQRQELKLKASLGYIETSNPNHSTILKSK